MRDALQYIEGDLNAAMAQYWNEIAGEGKIIPWTIDSCAALAASCREGAANIEATKFAIIAKLTATAAELAVAGFGALATGGTSLAAAAAAEASATVAMKELMRRLVIQLGKQVALSSLKSIAFEAGAQDLQGILGRRDRPDFGRVGDAAWDGAKAGAIEGVGKPIAKGVFKKVAGSPADLIAKLSKGQ
jgi:hypothetical protein